MAPRYQLPANALRNVAAAMQQRDAQEMGYRIAELRTLGIMLTSDPAFRRQFRGLAHNNGSTIDAESAFNALCTWLETMRAVLSKARSRPR